MLPQGSKHSCQALLAAEALNGILGESLLAVYLHGSAVSGYLKPQSDIDLLAVVNRGLSDAERAKLLSALLRLSGRHPRLPGHPRCLEVIVFSLTDLTTAIFPMRAEFLYGEWLRDAFEAGRKAEPTADPEHTLVLAQARQKAIALTGAHAADLLPEISPDEVRQAMRDSLPGLLAGFQGDERNVLLTLARMWRTAVTGEFVPKEAAAAWAIPRITDREATPLDHARRAHLGETVDDWGEHGREAKRLAEALRERILDLL